jgi:DNA-directed RNA polymerase specialized sigma24 family protein
MSSTGSVTQWVEKLRTGNRDAVQHLWERYGPELVRLARKQLRKLRVDCRVSDEDDVALGAFYSFCRGAERGRFPQLENRDRLCAVLACITARKAIDLWHYERREKRGGGKVNGESVLNVLFGTEDGCCGIDQVKGREPPPDVALREAERFLQLLAKLPKEELRKVALDRVEGYTNAEIAVRQKCAVSTVERRMDLIRKCWAKEPRC